MNDRKRGHRPAEEYRRLWLAEQTPTLEDFLDSLPNLTPDDLLDLVETDRVERWRRGERIRAEHYLNAFPAIRTDPESALVVIYGEYFLRKELGDTPSLMEYIARFPQHARRLRDQVMWHEAIELGNGPDGTLPPTIPGYAVGELLGRGGMCSVYLAQDQATGQSVAIKILDQEHVRHPVRAARFRRESASLMRLRHPHIVSALSIGDVGGVPYLVMELCGEGTLARQLGGQPLEEALARQVLRELASAVQYANEQGIVHRDLKPSNVLLARTGPGSGAGFRADPTGFVPKLADFGLAKCEAERDGSITATKETLGTPCYMAPELTTGARDADGRTDVYGLGAILYELLTGRPPFLGSTPLDVVRMVREDLPTPPRQLNPRVSAELEAICLRCLAKDADDRFPSAADLCRSLDGDENLVL